MASTQGIPVMMVGRSAENGKGVIALLQPDYDVVHFCETVPSAKEEIPTVLQGLPVHAATPIGSNAHRTNTGSKLPTPEFIFMGAGFPDEDFEEVKAAVGELPEGIRWARERRSDFDGLGLEKDESWHEAAGRRVPKPEIIAQAARRVFARAKEEGT
ncbi:hypothetical protein W97_05380 [Coniosporium apollinis CBS 100218]|uniref:Uncharacterized protein n=1 Tax=Coniosporium apollinis (strain CBS 100218) TaxID=1168221 RepID=R7YW72_CONA1|nr:uncharacterized protein W97_05380 [Coniosporium apollinis CBS 100218]EON66137.1 hypothetical protein W97_05380 [Coniosporium apollinis CBS 100218]